MAATTRVTTRLALYEERKRQYLALGYVIESEQPIAINGLCSFVVTKPEVASTGQCFRTTALKDRWLLKK